MDLTLARLSALMGGSPGESFISKIETGHFVPTPALSVKLADALRLPPDVLLNAAGHATEEQQRIAEEKLRAEIFETPPVSVFLSIVSADNPDRSTSLRRAVLLRKKEDAFITDLIDPANDPYVGECIVARGRTPSEGQGVVVRIGDTLSGWTWHSLPRGGEFLENGRGAKVTDDFSILGVIIRVTTSRDFGV